MAKITRATSSGYSPQLQTHSSERKVEVMFIDGQRFQASVIRLQFRTKKQVKHLHSTRFGHFLNGCWLTENMYNIYLCYT